MERGKQTQLQTDLHLIRGDIETAIEGIFLLFNIFECIKFFCYTVQQQQRHQPHSNNNNKIITTKTFPILHNFFDSVISSLPPHETPITVCLQKSYNTKENSNKTWKEILKRSKAHCAEHWERERNTETRRLVGDSLSVPIYLHHVTSIAFFLYRTARAYFAIFFSRFCCCCCFLNSLFKPFSRWFCFSSLFGFLFR